MPNLTRDELRQRIAALQEEATALKNQFTTAVVSRDPQGSASELADLFEQYLKAGDRLQQAVERLEDVEERTASDYEQRVREEAQFARDMEDLAKIHEAKEWERRLQLLIDRINETPGRFVNRRSVAKWRGRLIKDMMTLFPNLTEAEAASKVDAAIGLEPPN